MKKIFLIDGSSMLSTHFFGNLPPSYAFAKTKEAKEKALEDALQTSDGIYTNAVFNMTKSILRLLKDYQPEYMAVCWDISRNTFRRKVYPQYKSHRKETAKPLSSQFGTMQKVLDKMGIPQFKLENYEADDLIGTISKKFSGENQVFIITKDRDALQLIDFNTTVWLNTKQSNKLFSEIKDIDSEFKHAPANHFPFSLDAFRLIYGLEPIQLADLKGFTGDSSDGIPGIDKLGEKGATPVLQTFGTIENFYKEIDGLEIKDIKKLLKGKNIKRINPEKMLEYKKIALMSKKLATIDTNVPLSNRLTLDHLRIRINEGKTREVFKELEFNSLLKNEMFKIR